MKLLYIYSDGKNEWNCSEWRCVMPMQAINKSGLAEAKMMSIGDFSEGLEYETVEWADVIIIQRNMFGSVIQNMLHWRFMGKTIILDVDDNYHMIPSSVLSFPFWRSGKQIDDKGNTTTLPFEPLQQLEIGASLVNAITAPSRVLVEDWKKYAPTFLIPNYPTTAPFTKAFESLQPLRPPAVGWGGSFSHIDSFANSNVGPALRRLKERLNFRLMIAGGDGRIAHMLRIPGTETIRWKLYHEWPTLLSEFTVGIAPLAGMYDQRRSWIKVLEYMLMGIPWIASDMLPYEDLRPYGALVRNSAKEWEQAIENALTYPDREQITRAREFALAQEIDLHVPELLETYQKIIDMEKPII